MAIVETSNTVESPKARSARQQQLVDLRASSPAKLVLMSSVLESMVTGQAGPGAKKTGSKARTCNDQYRVGLTVQAIIEACPVELRKYAKACIIWDFQHGWVELSGLAVQGPVAPVESK
jgi:hypothetical protein